jgi:hypothetical protein
MGVGAGSHEARMLGIPGHVTGDTERVIVAIDAERVHACSDPAKNRTKLEPTGCPACSRSLAST